MNHAKLAGLGQGHIDAGHAEICPSRHMLRHHDVVVHFIHVIAGQYYHILWSVAANQVKVLEYRIGRTLIPVLADPLLRRQDVDKLMEAAVEEAPAALQVLDQALRLVLRGDADAADAGIHAIRQGEVDDAELAAERNRRLRPPVGELHQTAAATAGQHDGESVVRELAGFLALERCLGRLLAGRGSGLFFWD